MENIENVLFKVLTPEFEKRGENIAAFPKDTSLITSGIIDSMTFINILLDLEDKLCISLDFSDADFNDIASIEGLQKFFLRSANST